MHFSHIKGCPLYVFVLSMTEELLFHLHAHWAYTNTIFQLDSVQPNIARRSLNLFAKVQFPFSVRSQDLLQIVQVWTMIRRKRRSFLSDSNRHVNCRDSLTHGSFSRYHRAILGRSVLRHVIQDSKRGSHIRDVLRIHVSYSWITREVKKLSWESCWVLTGRELIELISPSTLLVALEKVILFKQYCQG